MSGAKLSVSNYTKLYAILSYIPGLWIIGLFKDTDNNSYINSHLRHGIYFSLCDMFAWVPGIGQFMLIATLILRILGIIYACTNRMYEFSLPILSTFANNLLRKMTMR
ncbi:MAG: hypothetical protein MJ153_00815 [Clostridia bacterium]|nr:hypothetical protein [Clostridia bacterium]